MLHADALVIDYKLDNLITARQHSWPQHAAYM